MRIRWICGTYTDRTGLRHISIPYVKSITYTKEDYFDKFAISKYMAWEVAQICEICEAHGWVKPAVYQGIYNALNRNVEAELFPCLRYYGMGFYAYNPLGGGFFTRAFTEESEVEEGSKFDPNRWQGKMYRARYFREE